MVIEQELEFYIIVKFANFCS